MADAGIYGLCVIGECELIEYLDLRRTKVTSEGVIMALQKFVIFDRTRARYCDGSSPYMKSINLGH